MMFKNNFVVSVKVAGKVLREFKDEVYVPFGAEYTLFLKNTNTRRAMVTVEIDGEDALHGSKLVVLGNSSIDLERYLKDANKGNKFKFIERTGSIENHRGVKAEDGLIRVTFAFEKHIPYFRQNPFYYKGSGLLGNGGLYGNAGGWGNGVDTTSASSVRGLSFDNSVNLSHQTYDSYSSNGDCSLSFNDAGITVPGSISDQKFTTTSWFATDEAEAITIKLVGDLGQNKVVSAPVTVKTKPKCVTCGRVNRASSKFCVECGTALEII